MIPDLKELERLVINSTATKRVQWFDEQGEGARAVISHGDLARLDRNKPASILEAEVTITFRDARANWEKVLSSALALISALQSSKEHKWIDDGITFDIGNEYAAQVRLKVSHFVR